MLRGSLCPLMQRSLLRLKSCQGLKNKSSAGSYRFESIAVIRASVRESRAFSVSPLQRAVLSENTSNQTSSQGIRQQKIDNQGGSSNSTTQDSNEFLLGDDLSSLGLHPVVSNAFCNACITRPSAIQVLAAEPIMDGRDVVIAAETGSGKTYAYLGPIVSQICEGITAGRGVEMQAALVLCPNAALCQQVVEFATKLRGTDGMPLVRAAWISAKSPPPQLLPHIVVSTPSALIRGSQDFPVAYGHFWSLGSIVNRMRWVVMDEADLLMGGGYLRDVNKIMSLMQQDDSRIKAEVISARLGISIDDFNAKPRLERKTALQALNKEISKQGRVSSPNTSAESSQSLLPTRGWWRQYIFVAATLPDDNELSPGAAINDYCRNAVWLAGDQLHKSVKRTHHNWVEVNEASWGKKLQVAVKHHLDETEGQGKTMVFSDTVASADEAAKVLQRAGLDSLVYHRNIPQIERDQIVQDAASRKGIILVCTDAAARGIDIPDISHVVQADFALNAIDFIHRVGRTGRMGKAGKVTSLYLPRSKDLAEALKAAVESGDLLEGTFSRNRSFGRKIKKYGKYVPRGQQG